MPWRSGQRRRCPVATNALFSDQEVQTATPKQQAPPQTGNNLFSDSEVSAASGGSAPSNPGAAIQPVTTSTNPKLAIAASGENMPEYVGATGAIGAGLMGLSAIGSAA